VAVKVKLISGLGNQLFQLAFGLSVAAARGAELQLETSFYADPRRSIELGEYRGDAPFFEAHAPLGNIGARRGRTPANPASDTAFYEPVHHGFIDPLKVPLDKILIGYWQNERYPLSVRTTLLQRAADVDRSLSGAAKDALSEIKGHESVAIHVRRGDYLEPKAQKRFGLCFNGYFRRAVAAVERRARKRGIVASQLTYFVFSDSPELVPNVISLPPGSIMVSGQGLAAREELALMRSAKHNIISNSTFGWWGAWLNESPTKIVVRPVPWYAETDPTGFVPPGWLAVPKVRRRWLSRFR
jgi:hypothetical protein